MAASEVVQHVTPDEESLSSISVNIRCPQGCPRTFANSSALRLHLNQVHRQESVSSVASKPGVSVWYHCPVESCIYHNNFGAKGRHFPNLKYLKQHFLKVHAARLHTCDCGQAFSTVALLARHQRACGVKLLCSCGNSFSSVETLQTHVRRSGHTFHHSTVQALRARKTLQTEPALTIQSPLQGGSSQEVWTHHIPLKYHTIDERGREEGGVVGIINTSSSVQSMFSSVLPTICAAPSTICSASSTFSQVTPLHLQQPTHLLAAIALSELAATAMKRSPCVDVGVQTETEVPRRSRRKSSPGKCWASAGNCTLPWNLSKRKRTAETQTRLSHRDSKRLQGGTLLHLSEAPAETGITTGTHNTNGENEATFIDIGAEDCNDDEGSFESLALQVNLPEFITAQQSTSGTQTSPRVAGLSHPQLHNLAISLFDRACGDDEPGIAPPSMSITSTQTPEHLDPFGSTQLFIDDDDDLLEVVSNTTVGGRRRPPSLGHIRSSSIETQTDHDVLLSKNADTPDDSDEIILTTTETQTDPNSLLILTGNSVYQSHGSCQASYEVHESDSLWCTSETQTYEDFSDIEQFMRSTIHTQTPDHSHNELFPELSFSHTQTQTSLDDPPSLVTTHTQTPTNKQLPSSVSEM
ncbi:uncharacterized protein Asciz [Procambarus clarkii]|uniref:uncharacterized protein Asciz n=1 Tax=Procambarus clarkii TaxID=6728 RepID=UPI001E678087|nr:uncharacterized protein LOC123766908 isoform X1 [Procambarus clarkii]XP_045612343.1 uncharacterized protein LOC123766908 isoform X1 [Procambarus clarkii]